MIVKQQNKQTGKTRDLLLMAHETKNVIVTINIDEAKRLKDLALEMQLEILDPIPFSDVINSRNGFDIKGYYFDNLDDMIQQLAGDVPVKIVTFTEEDN